MIRKVGAPVILRRVDAEGPQDARLSHFDVLHRASPVQDDVITRCRLVLQAALVALVLAAQPLHADDFHKVASGLRSLGFERTWIPFMGLARTFVKITHPKGVHDFQVAVYENSPSVSGVEVERMIKSRVARGFTPLVRVYSKAKGESVFIYARPSRDSRTVELIVLSHEPGETVLVRVTADAAKVGRELGIPEKVGNIAAR